MEFHISRALRNDLAVDDTLFRYTGNVVFGNVAASRKLARKLKERRGASDAPDAVVNAGALFAMGLIDEINHALVERFREEVDPAVLTDALRWFGKRIGEPAVDKLLLGFCEEFPGIDVYRGELTAKDWLAGDTNGMPNREAAFEELMMLHLANMNPALQPFRELFDNRPLKQSTAYETVAATLSDYFETRPVLDPEIGTLLEALTAPMLASPDSLTGQLDFIRTKWAPQMGPDLKRVLLAVDTLREEDIAIWMRFNPAAPDKFQHGAPGGVQGFEGDEYVGFNEYSQSCGNSDFVIGADGGRKRKYAVDYQAPLNEYEAFSADQAWMPNVVMMAKSTYVWLEQLSQKYGRHIHRLDHIPDEELQLLADRGITALWLIGLWERSTASQTIKRLRGHADAVASAYSLKEYRIADDLGGNQGYEVLRDRAARFNIRLASDMVPNHMGIDSNWVIEHPEWFLARWESPFPVYTFNGPDLSPDSRVEIKIEDHYYDQTDAAVAFRIRHYASNETRYMYHGNDGTTFAWNDTAQLDYSKAAVREHVIQVILYVARLFPIIRFDAAMVLAKRHVQRLWFPLPGAGGSIPSRAEDAMSQEEFEALMPAEFWREVVDRVAVEVPGTLLLAEAFWLLEGYFVRTLGMHRVYNSAFMVMLRDEENAKYRSYLKKTVEFDPDILKRYVNFMSNPDEKTAIDQFGNGDKCFGVATLLATLPGLPMFGHGQVEGFTERYGMEYKQAKLREVPDQGLIARHQHEIAPLLKRRAIFAESENFLLFDFWMDNGTVDENVFAYSNRSSDGQRSIILYNNTFGSTHGTIHLSAASVEKSTGFMGQRSLAHGLALPGDDRVIVLYRDTVTKLSYLRRVTTLRDRGLTLPLRGYGYAVLLDWQELTSSSEHPWDALCDALNGAGVADAYEALSRMRTRRVLEALRHAVSGEIISKFAASTPVATAKNKPTQTSDLPKADTGFSVAEPQIVLQEDNESPLAIVSLFDASANVFYALQEVAPTEQTLESYRGTLEALAQKAVSLAAITTTWPVEAQTLLPTTKTFNYENLWAPIMTWMLLASYPGSSSPQAFDALQLRAPLAEVFASRGLEGEQAWRAAARVRLLLTPDASVDMDMTTETFWSQPDVRWLNGIHEANEKTYFNREDFEALTSWLQVPSMLQAAANPKVLVTLRAAFETHSKAASVAGYCLEIFLAPGEQKSQAFVPPDPVVSLHEVTENNRILASAVTVLLKA